MLSGDGAAGGRVGAVPRGHVPHGMGHQEYCAERKGWRRCAGTHHVLSLSVEVCLQWNPSNQDPSNQDPSNQDPLCTCMSAIWQLQYTYIHTYIATVYIHTYIHVYTILCVYSLQKKW